MPNKCCSRLTLLAKNFVAQQTVETEKNQVAQLAAAVQADEAQIESTRLRLSYARLASPADLASSALPFVLSLIAGSADIVGFLGLKGLFTAHITGNLVVLAAHIVAGNPAILSYILSVPVFMMMLFLTRVLAGGLQQTGVSMLWPLLLLQLFFLAAFLSICVVAGPWRDANAILAVIAGMFGVAAMAVQNALVQILLTNTPSTAVMTSNVTHFMLDLGEVLVGRDHAKVARARTRALHTVPVIVGFTIDACSARLLKLLLGCGLWPCQRGLPCSPSQWVSQIEVAPHEAGPERPRQKGPGVRISALGLQTTEYWPQQQRSIGPEGVRCDQANVRWSTPIGVSARS